MESDRAPQPTAIQSLKPSEIKDTPTDFFNSADLFNASNFPASKSIDTIPTSTKAEPATLELTNPFARTDAMESTLVADNKPAEKPLRRSDLPDFKKFTQEEQAKTAANLAKEITEKGFKDSPELRDKVRAAMLRAYMDGDKDGAGNQKAMEKFVEQISEKLPKGMSLKIDSSETNKDLAAFREKARAAIDKQPGMKMGTSGQLQLCKTENGTTQVVDKLHFAASIRKTPPSAKA